MTRRSPRSTRPTTLCPNTTLCRPRIQPPELHDGGEIRRAQGDAGCRLSAGSTVPAFGPSDDEKEDRRAPEGPKRPGRRGGQELRESCLRPALVRSEEHTSELQSLLRLTYAVLCLKKTNKQTS